MESELVIVQEGSPSTTIHLSRDDGIALKELLEKSIDCRLTSYCHKVGLQYSNLANMLNGNKKLSLKSLERICSSAPLMVECQVEFVIRRDDTKDAENAHLESLEDLLFLEELENAPEEQ